MQADMHQAACRCGRGLVRPWPAQARNQLICRPRSAVLKFLGPQRRCVCQHLMKTSAIAGCRPGPAGLQLNLCWADRHTGDTVHQETCPTDGSCLSGCRHTSMLCARSCRQLKQQICQAEKQQFKSFDDMVAKCDVPLLVDWNAVWCGPCQMMSGALKVGIKAWSLFTWAAEL